MFLPSSATRFWRHWSAYAASSHDDGRAWNRHEKCTHTNLSLQSGLLSVPTAYVSLSCCLTLSLLIIWRCFSILSKPSEEWSAEEEGERLCNTRNSVGLCVRSSTAALGETEARPACFSRSKCSTQNTDLEHTATRIQDPAAIWIFSPQALSLPLSLPVAMYLSLFIAATSLSLSLCPSLSPSGSLHLFRLYCI